MWLSYPHSMVKIQAVIQFSVDGFMIGAFYWLFLWDFKKESLSRFLWHSQNKKLPVRPTGGFLFIGDKERIL